MKNKTVIITLLIAFMCFTGSFNDKIIAYSAIVDHWKPQSNFELMLPGVLGINDSNGKVAKNPDFIQYQILLAMNIRVSENSERLLSDSLTELLTMATSNLSKKYDDISLDKKLYSVKPEPIFSIKTPRICGGSILVANFIDKSIKKRNDEFKRQFLIDIVSEIDKVLPKFISDLPKIEKNDLEVIKALNSIGFIGPDGIGKPADSIDEIYTHDLNFTDQIQDASDVRIAVLDTGVSIGLRKSSGLSVSAGATLKSRKMSFKKSDKVRSRTKFSDLSVIAV